MISIIQGEFATSDNEGDIMTAVLGSCVAACIFDPIAKVGGMNHFLLPEAGSHASSHVLYGTQAMELLINGIMKLGGRKERMQAKLFGGGKVIKSLSCVGEANAKFAVRFMSDEKIPVVSQSLGGERARRVRFSPVGGMAQQMTLSEYKPIEKVPVVPQKPAPDIVLF